MLGGCLGGALLSLLVPLVLVKKGLNRLLPEANFVAMSISSLALIGILQPNLLTRSRQEVPTRNAPMTLESVMLGSSVRCFENL
jgi:hypothetical protein